MAKADKATAVADIAEQFDLVVVAEGGVFSDQAKLKWPEGVSHDYGQTAWVGQVQLDDDGRAGMAFERFTTSGPAALLPLPPGPVLPGGPSGRRAALVWCVQQNDDPVRELDDAQRLTLLNTIFHPAVGRITQLSPLKAFPLGLNAHRQLVNDGAVVRIGNAAQTLHPVAGQGFNLGMRDVHVLLDALKHTPWSPEDDAATRQMKVRRALRQFERRRQPDRWALLATTDFLARSFTWPAPVLATLRGMGIGAVGALSPVKRLLARSMMCGWHERLADLAEQLERVCRHHLSCHNVVATFSSINMIMWPLSMKAACAMRIGRSCILWNTLQPPPAVLFLSWM